MGNININIRNKHAFTDVLSEGPIVCANSDYTLTFDFDSEWDSEKVKTVRVIHGSTYTDIVMDGNECSLPEVRGVAFIAVGVYAGNIKTTTPAIIPCDASITCKNGTPAAPSEDVYNQIMALLNDVAHDAREATDNFNAHVEAVNNGEYQPDYNDNDASSKNHIKNRPFYAGVVNTNVAFGATDTAGELQTLNMKVDIDTSKTYIGRAYISDGSTMDVPLTMVDASSELGLPEGSIIVCEIPNDLGTLYFGATEIDGEIIVGDYVAVTLNATKKHIEKCEILQLDESTGEYVNVTCVTEVIKKIDGKFIDFPISSSVKEGDKNAVSGGGVYEYVGTVISNLRNDINNKADRDTKERFELVYDNVVETEVASIVITSTKTFDSNAYYPKRIFVHIEIPYGEFDDFNIYFERRISSGKYLQLVRPNIAISGKSFIDACFESISGGTFASLVSYLTKLDSTTNYSDYSKPEAKPITHIASHSSVSSLSPIIIESSKKFPVGTKIKVWGEYEV